MTQGLRLHDNPALVEAIKDTQNLYPIFILDPHFQDPSKVGPNRMQFLLESLSDLDQSLQQRGSRLFVIQGTPLEVFRRIFKEWSITKLCYEYDTEPYAVARDTSIQHAARQAAIQVHSHISHTLYDPHMLIQKSGGKPPLTMKAFEKLIDLIGDPPLPLEAPSLETKFPSFDATYFPKDKISEYAVPKSLECLPNYKSLQATTPYHGGESLALQRMAEYLQDTDQVARFEKPKGNPAQIPIPATTVLSPYLKFGCLSARLFHSKLLEIYKKKKGHHTKPPVSLRGQLLWREFFYCASLGVANFGTMKGNRICKQIDWDDNPEFLKAWEESRTGFPWIDAIMNQLKTEGWMHHLARHSVACFLTRGDLYCSWESGRDIFDKYLLDADWALNSANWMWLSASAFFHQYFRVYSPVAFGKQYDKNGDYIRKYVPVLGKMPAKYIYEPWLAPRQVQEAAGCIVGKDYPMPIVDHSEIVKVNMQRMKNAYSSNGGDGSGGVDEETVGKEKQVVKEIKEKAEKKKEMNGAQKKRKKQGGDEKKTPSVLDMMMKKKQQE